MENKPIRILQVFGGLNFGGSETAMMTYYRKIDKSKVQFDFVVHDDKNTKFDYEDQVRENGGQVFRLPRYKISNHAEYKKAWFEILDNHPEYCVVHGHHFTLAFVYFFILRKRNLCKIGHAHAEYNGASLQTRIIRKLQTFPLRFLSDRFLACTNDAGRWIFGNKVLKSDRYLVLKNAIDADRFKFDSISRQQLREQHSLQDEFVVGNVGRISEQKNQLYLLEIFKRLLAISDNKVNYKLLLIGNGVEKENNKLLEKIQELDLNEKVIWLKRTPEVNKYMQMMDVFVFPSKYEGLGIVAVEAQAAGLKVIASDTIPRDINLDGEVDFLSVNSSPETWAQKIYEYSLNKSERLDKSKIIKDNGYDINQNTALLQDYYLNLHELYSKGQ